MSGTPSPSVSGHPLGFKDSGGSAYTTGVTVNGTALATGFSFNNNLLTFTVAATPPASLVNVPTDGPSIGVGLFQFTVANNATNLTIPIGCKVTGANTAGAPVITDRTVGIGSISFTLNIAQNYVTGALLNFTNDIVVTGKWTTVGETPVYRLGTVTFTNGALSSHQLQRVTRSELYHLLGSNLTKPTQAFPIYIYEDEKLFVYPTTINSGINADYIKKPAAPSWNFTVGTQNQYIYDGYHWGFIFSHSFDLLRGKEPYIEIFLEYGFLIGQIMTSQFHSC